MQTGGRQAAVLLCAIALMLGIQGPVVFAVEPAPAKFSATALRALNGTDLVWQVPLMSGPITIDGHIDPEEWGAAVKTCGLLDTRGRLVTHSDAHVWVGTDGQTLFVAMRSAGGSDEPGQGLVAKTTERDGPVWEDDAVEILACADTDGTVYHMIVNSAGTIYDAVRPVGARADATRQIAFRHASRVEDGWWNIEVAIPFTEIGSPTGSLKLNVCRNWHARGASSLTGAARFVDPAGMLTLRWDRQAPCVRLHGLGTLAAGHVHADIEIAPNGPAPLQVRGWVWSDLTQPDAAPFAEFAETVSGHWRGAFTVRLPRSETRHRLTLAVADAEGKLLHTRILDFDLFQRATDPRPVTAEALLAGHTRVYARHYPGYRRLSLMFDPFAYEGADIAEIRVALRGPAGEVRTGKALRQTDGLWKALVGLDSDTEGTWSVDVTCLGMDGTTVARQDDLLSFEKKRWIWEDNRLGISDTVIPPFTPLAVERDRVSSVLRRHTMNGLGLWQQVQSLGREIFVEPMSIQCRIDGVAYAWQADPLRFIQTEPHAVTARARAVAGGLTWEATATYDYDGFMWLAVNLTAARRLSIERLVLRIPLKAAEATLMHACADRIRRNKAGAIPAGVDEVWNSAEVEKYQIAGRRLIDSEFIPYLWLGGEERGLCWMADNSLGFSLETGKPAMRVLRPTPDVVVAEIDLINQATELEGTRRLEFGLQATPVKPLPTGWRNWHFGCGNYIPGMINISFGVHGLGTGQTVGWWKYPLNHDYSYLEYLRRATRTKKEDVEFRRRWMAQTHNDYLQWAEKNIDTLTPGYTKHLKPGETIPELWIRWRDIYMKQWSNLAARSDRLVPYTDQRLQIVDNPETEYFAAEWWSPQRISYAGAMRTFLTPSNIAFTLYGYKKMLEHGFDGIYLDDTYIMPGNEPDNDTAVVDNGRVLPRMGLLATRELIKRLAVIQHELGLSPRLIIVHMSNAFLIPAFAFADVSYDWEMAYGAQDFQDRFTLDFIRAESIGRQAGMVPAVLGGIQKPAEIPWRDWLQGEKKRLTRTSLGMTLIHEIRINHQKHAVAGDLLYQTYRTLHRFDIANPDCTFVPYWRNDPRVVAHGGDFRTSFYTRPDRALLIITNMGDEARADIRVDCTALGIAPNTVLVDAESGAVLGSDGLPVPRHDFRLVYVGSEEAGKALHAPDPKPGEL